MARHARLIVPNLPHHVVQRGHNRADVFRSAPDFPWYLRMLHELASVFGVRVYAYCLMTNHVHLVMDPGDDPSSIPRLMKRIAGRHTRRVNRREERTGSLWEGRYHSSPVDTDSYLLACCRYVDLNPVRAGLVKDPEAYRWSSYRDRVSGLPSWLTPDPCYLGLGPSAVARANAYRKFVAAGVGPEIGLLRTAVRRSQLTGDAAFVAAVAASTGRLILPRSPGGQRRAAARLANRSVPFTE